jgi:hypothetical protein
MLLRKIRVIAVAAVAVGCGTSASTELFGPDDPRSRIDAGQDAVPGSGGDEGRVDGSTLADASLRDGGATDVADGSRGSGDGSVGDGGVATTADSCPTIPSQSHLIDCSKECEPNENACVLVKCNSALFGNTNFNFDVGEADLIVRTPANPRDADCEASCRDWPPAPPVAPAYGLGMRFTTSRKFRVRVSAPYQMQEMGFPNSRNPAPVFCPWEQGDGGSLKSVCGSYPQGLHDTLLVWTNDTAAPERNVYVEFDQDCP